jgi:cyanophycin synthetase
VLGVSGDQPDDQVREAGVAAGEHFDAVIAREDADTGGRGRGDTAALLFEGLSSTACEQARIVLDEATAVATALDAAAEHGGNVVVAVFIDDDSPTPGVLERRGAVWCERPRITGLPTG